MSHLYASLGQFKRYVTGGDYEATRDGELLVLLGSSSRAVDAFCQRGSGFGPVIESRTFCVAAAGRLLLKADLVEVTDWSVDASPPTVTARTRVIVDDRLTRGLELTITGAWSYDYALVPVGTVSGVLEVDATEGTLPENIDVGHMLRVEDEDVLVTALVEGTATIQRGMNGTTAAEHADGSVLSLYTYASEAVDATLRVGQRRWKQRDAGLTGVFGGVQAGGGVPMTSHQDSEWSILLSTISHLRFGFVR